MLRAFVDVGAAHPNPSMGGQVRFGRVDPQKKLGVNAPSAEQRPQRERARKTDDVRRPDAGGEKNPVADAPGPVHVVGNRRTNGTLPTQSAGQLPSRDRALSVQDPLEQRIQRESTKKGKPTSSGQGGKTASTGTPRPPTGLKPCRLAGTHPSAP